MAATTLILTMKNTDDKKTTTTISYVNPQATNDKLRTLAQTIAVMTKDKLQTITKEVQETI